MGRLLREFCKKTEKEAKRLKKWLTRGNNFDNMNKLSRRGAPKRGATEKRKRTKKSSKKQLTKAATCDILKKLAKSERDRRKRKASGGHEH